MSPSGHVLHGSSTGLLAASPPALGSLVPQPYHPGMPPGAGAESESWRWEYGRLETFMAAASRECVWGRGRAGTWVRAHRL